MGFVATVLIARRLMLSVPALNPVHSRAIPCFAIPQRTPTILHHRQDDYKGGADSLIPLLDAAMGKVPAALRYGRTLSLYMAGPFQIPPAR